MGYVQEGKMGTENYRGVVEDGGEGKIRYVVDQGSVWW